MYRTNVLGVRSVIDACIRYGVRRLVHVSSVHAIPELPQGTVQTEIRDYDPERVTGGYAKTKALGARSVMETWTGLTRSSRCFPALSARTTTEETTLSSWRKNIYPADCLRL